MIPQKGQQIRCIFRNNLIIEGVVEYWSDQQSILQTSDNSGTFIIHNTLADIMVTKVIDKTSSIIVKNELENKFEEVYQNPSNDDLRVKKMAELKTLMIKQDKKILAEKIKDHNIDNIKQTTYQQPNIFNKK